MPLRYLSSLLQKIWIIHLQHMVLHQENKEELESLSLNLETNFMPN